MSNALLTWLAIALAVALDLWLIRRLRQYWGQRSVGDEASRPEVRLFGVYSPALTWLKYRTLPSRPPGSALLPNVSRQRIGPRLELLAIVAVAAVYAGPLLNFNPDRTLPGNEYGAHVGPMSLFIQWLAGETDFPLWNPVVGYGRSLIADPFLFVFNPFLSLPMAFWGVVNGSRVAVVLNFAIVGLGVWVLCWKLGFEWPARLWCSLLYLLSGALPAHLAAGQLQLTFALGWLPWSVAGFLWTIESRSWRALAAGSLVQALFFFTGNFYYQLYGLVCLLIIGAVYTIRLKPIRLDLGLTRRTLILGLVSLGLIAIQFLPQIASRSSIRNVGGYLPGETEFLGSQTPEHALINYLVSDRDFSESPLLDKAPYVQESYRYIGIAPMLLLLLLAPAFQRGRRREIVAFTACVLLMLAWASIGYSFIQEIYRAFPFLYQFRWPGRALSVGALFLIVLSGIGLDELWTRLRSLLSRPPIDVERGAALLAIRARAALPGLLIVGLALSLNGVFAANQALVYLDDILQPEVNASLAWLRAQDGTEYSVFATDGAAIQGALQAYNLRLRVLTIVDGWFPAMPASLLGPVEAVTLQPKYWLIWESEQVDRPQARLLRQFDTVQVWHTPGGFPYAFLVPAGRLTAQPPALDPREVRPVLSARRDGPNRVRVEAEADQASVLIISEAWFSGWKVIVGGQPAEIASVSGLLAVALPPGRHSVVFEYDPVSFKLGVAVSGLTLAFSAGMVIREWRRSKGRVET